MELDKTNPDEHHHIIKLVERQAINKYEARYTHEQLDSIIHAIYDNLEELHEGVYESLTKIDENFKVAENGNVKIGYMHPKKKEIKYLNIPTVKQEVDQF